MKVLNFISTLDLNAGGPTISLKNQLNYISDSGSTNEYHLLAMNSKEKLKNDILNPRIRLFYFNSFLSLLKKLFYSKYDLAHIHGIWQIPNLIFSFVTNFKNIPYIVSPRGMLEPWSLQQSFLLKKVALFVYQRKILNNSSVIHATSQMELLNLRKLGFRNKIALIPNGIDLHEYQDTEVNKENTILFISRIHPKKGLELLIEALEVLNKKNESDWKCEIYGSGDQNYIDSLKLNIIKKGLMDRVVFFAPIYSSKKINKIKSAKVLVLPSYSENFGNIIAESLACKTPVISSVYTPWNDLEEYNCGWQIELQKEDLLNKIEHVLSLTDSVINKMGENGRFLIEKKYDIKIVSKKFENLYEYILGISNKPDFIYD